MHLPPARLAPPRRAHPHAEPRQDAPALAHAQPQPQPLKPVPATVPASVSASVPMPMPVPVRASTTRRSLCLALAAACAGGLLPPGGSAHAAAELDLPALMALLSRRKGGQARFSEVRTVATLDAPLRASGRLSFEAPDRFARHNEQPRAESMEVQGNQVLLRRGSRSRQLALDSVPELAALADAMRGTLNGDAAVLQRHFRVGVAGSSARWRLTLTPADAQLAQSVERIEISGVGADVRAIDLRLAGGDRSLMTIEPMQAADSASSTGNTPASEGAANPAAGKPVDKSADKPTAAAANPAPAAASR